MGQKWKLIYTMQCMIIMEWKCTKWGNEEPLMNKIQYGFLNEAGARYCTLMHYTHLWSHKLKICHWAHKIITRNEIVVHAYWSNFHGSFFLGIQLTRKQQWFRLRLGTEYSPNVYLRQWWPYSLSNMYPIELICTFNSLTHANLHSNPRYIWIFHMLPCCQYIK